ncbi:5'-nucleotidase [Balneolales bacterium ANBcel1]|nr:5'-nucleotidase [Balneolales bacterium ANBcel1]
MSIPFLQVRPARLIYLFLPFVLFLGSCSTTRQAHEYVPDTGSESHVYYDIDDEIEEDEAMSAFIHPYVREMGRTMNQVLTHSEGSFERGSPEGALGNLTADIVRYRATAEMREKVHVGILNNGGLRVPLPEGDITVRLIYELMPFENHIAVLKVTGEQLLQIVDELAAANGEPVSGIRFRIDNGRARDVLVDSMEVVPERRYWIATNNWMADGGGASPTLWNPQERIDLDVMIRDAIIEYLRGMESIAPYTDQRIRNQVP